MDNEITRDVGTYQVYMWNIHVCYHTINFAPHRWDRVTDSRVAGLPRPYHDMGKAEHNIVAHTLSFVGGLQLGWRPP